MLKLIPYNYKKHRNQGQIQKPCFILDEALCNFLPLPVVAKSSLLNVAEFLDSSLKTSPCTKTSPVLCENQSFFLLFRNLVTFIKIHFVILYYFLLYLEVLLSNLFDVCYHYLVFMDPVNGCSKQ